MVAACENQLLRSGVIKLHRSSGPGTESQATHDPAATIPMHVEPRPENFPRLPVNILRSMTM